MHETRRDTCFEKRSIDRFQEYRPRLDSAGRYYAVPRKRLDTLRTGIETLLLQMQEAGVGVESAYFRGHANMCAPPDSRVGMTVIVPAQMVIRVSDSTRSTALENLQKVEKPHFTCPYSIVKLTPAACP